MDLARIELASSLLQIIWIDLILSSDNALVIGMACRGLPERQRRIGMALGAGAAALLRIVFTLLFLQILGIPFIKFAGGVILLWIAVRIVDEDADDGSPAPGSLWDAVRIIVIADGIMSLDNIIAIAGAAHGSWPLIVFGLILSIPIIILGSIAVTQILNRFPLLVWIGVGILGWVAGELIGSDPALLNVLGSQAPGAGTWPFAAAGAAFTVAFSWLRARRIAAVAGPDVEGA